MDSEKLVELLGTLDPSDLSKKQFRDTIVALIVAKMKLKNHESKLAHATNYVESAGASCPLCIYVNQTIDKKCGYHTILDKLRSDFSKIQLAYLTLQQKAPRLDAMVQMAARIKRLTANNNRGDARIKEVAELLQKLFYSMTDEQLKQHNDIITKLVDWRTKAASDPIEEIEQ